MKIIRVMSVINEAVLKSILTLQRPLLNNTLKFSLYLKRNTLCFHQLKLFRKTITAYCENHTKHKYTLRADYRV